MPLDDIVFDSSQTSEVSRGNGGIISDIMVEKPTYLVSPNYFGGYWSVTETFKDSTDTNIADGTIVQAFHYSTHALVGEGTISGGSTTIVVSTSDQVYLVLVEIGGETVRTTNITPV